MRIHERWRDAIADLNVRTRLSQPEQLPDEVNAAIAPLGIDARIYLIDYEQRTLWPVPDSRAPAREPLPVDTTVAGQAFMASEVLVEPELAAGRRRLWIPLLDGSERLGVLEVLADVETADAPGFSRECDAFTALLGHLVVSKSMYGDHLEHVRRTRRMSVGSELLWQVLPPLTFACDRFVISAILEPSYDVGGDGFDYAVGGPNAFFAVLDTAGHGLPAALGTSVALAAIRSARRSGDDLPAIARAVDTALTEQFTDARFTTAVLAELNLDTGLLRYVNAGHPPPLVLRGSTVVARLDEGGRMPLGLPDPDPGLSEVVMRPGDRVLCYTDGVTEARDAAGDEFGEQRLVELAEAHAAAELPAPETLRRLTHAVLTHMDGPPSDDATLMLLEWSPRAGRRTLP